MIWQEVPGSAATPAVSAVQITSQEVPVVLAFPPAPPARLQGIDCYEGQGVVYWDRVKRFANWAYIKATEGVGEAAHRDSQFPRNWAESRRFGLVRGAYSYLLPDLDGAAQADTLHGYVRANGHFVAGDFIVLDLETMGHQAPAQVVSCAEAFVVRARQQIAKPVWLYCGYYFWQSLGSPASPILKICPLIVPSYGSPPQNPGWSVITGWQDSSTATVPGVFGPCDTDVFFGTRAQLAELTRPL